MCGGLVTASCGGGKDILNYQIGRLVGYLLLGTFAFAAGYVLRGVVSFHWAPLISGVFMGVVFIFWGIRSFNGRRAELPLPKFLGKSYQYLYRRFVTRAGAFRSFIIGLLSILLPCGLIYGLIIAALAVGEYQQVMTSLFFFWLGTLPAMLGAPHLVRKFLAPLKAKLPKAYAIIFIVVGVATIAGRLNHLPASSEVDRTSDGKIQRCH